MPDGVVVITGGSGDIGRALTQILLAEGRRVANWDLAERTATPDAISHDKNYLFCPCDVARPGSVDVALAATHEQLGRVSALVNAAGIGHHSEFVSMTAEQWNRVIEVNLCGPVNAVRAVLPDLLERGDGVVLNVCSIWSRASGTNRTAYIASKWGLLGVTQALSAELAGRGVRFCAISPGLVDTAMSRGLADDEARRSWLSPQTVAEVMAAEIAAEEGVVGGEIQIYGRVRPVGMR